MIPVYICDDDGNMRARIATIAEQQIAIQGLGMGPIQTVDGPEALLQLCKDGVRPALYLLDVDLDKDMDGFQLASRIRDIDPAGFIIFITGHPELSFETFKYRLEAMDYIVKGDEDEMRKRLQECLTIVQQRITNRPAGEAQYYTIKIFDTLRNIPYSQILYFEAMGAAHRICLYTDNEMMEFFGSLQAVEDELGDSFFRCHRGFLVNRARIAHIDLKENKVVLDSEDWCPLSRNAKKNIQ